MGLTLAYPTPTQPVQTAHALNQQDRYRTALIRAVIGVLELHGQSEAAEIVERNFLEND